MIEINLLPEELRLKNKKPDRGPFPAKYLLYAFAVALAGLILLHVGLFAAVILKNTKVSALNNKWKELEPQRRLFEQSKKNSGILSSDAKAVQQLLKQRVGWSKKLNKLSLDLPSGVWFGEMSLNQKDFLLKGSAVSMEKAEMSLINKFIGNLKDDPDFFGDLAVLELGSVQRRSIGGYDIIDFVFSGKLK